MSMTRDVMRICALMLKHAPTDELAISVAGELCRVIAENATVEEIYRSYRTLGGALEFDEFQRRAREYQIMVTGETEEEFVSLYAAIFATETLEFSEQEALI